MCLIVFAYHSHPKYRLILTANRDEFYERKTAPAGWWHDKFGILGGRDLEAGGTWMAVSRTGRFAAVTNYRDIKNIRNDARSRGDLPVRFLEGGLSPADHVASIAPHAADYNGFNLITYANGAMAHFSNYENKANELSPGIYGLSNALLDTPWPKVERAKARFSDAIADDFDALDLINTLNDAERAADEVLPNTGIGLKMERALSAMRIDLPDYGTCCATVLTIDYNNRIRLIEKNYPVGGRKEGVTSFDFLV